MPFSPLDQLDFISMKNSLCCTLLFLTLSVSAVAKKKKEKKEKLCLTSNLVFNGTIILPLVTWEILTFRSFSFLLQIRILNELKKKRTCFVLKNEVR